MDGREKNHKKEAVNFHRKCSKCRTCRRRFELQKLEIENKINKCGTIRWVHSELSRSIFLISNSILDFRLYGQTIYSALPFGHS